MIICFIQCARRLRAGPGKVPIRRDRQVALAVLLPNTKVEAVSQMRVARGVKKPDPVRSTRTWDGEVLIRSMHCVRRDGPGKPVWTGGS